MSAKFIQLKHKIVRVADVRDLEQTDNVLSVRMVDGTEQLYVYGTDTAAKAKYRECVRLMCGD